MLVNSLPSLHTFQYLLKIHSLLSINIQIVLTAAKYYRNRKHTDTFDMVLLFQNKNNVIDIEIFFNITNKTGTKERIQILSVKLYTILVLYAFVISVQS